MGCQLSGGERANARKQVAIMTIIIHNPSEWFDKSSKGEGLGAAYLSDGKPEC